MLHVVTKTLAEPDRIVDLLAESIAPDLKQSQFISFLLVSLDPVSHEVHFANAGHAPALHLDTSNATFRRLEATRLPLGFPRLLSGQTLPHLMLAPGDLLVLGTDGCIEVRDASGAMFGCERLEELVLTHRTAPAAEIVAAIRDAVLQFHGRPLLPDDSTLLIVKRQI